MGACLDATCVECGAHIGWFGKITDRPPCPRCGHQVSKAELQGALAEVEEVIAGYVKRVEGEMAARTHEEISATENGRNAYKADMKPIDGLWASPYRPSPYKPRAYSRVDETLNARLHKWFMHGFYAAEHEHHAKGGG